MKRLLTFLLALCYLLTGSGVLLQQHYCMGEYVDGRLAFVHEEDTHNCSKCGMEQKSSNGCCETKTQLLKKAQDEQVQQLQDWVQALQAPALLPEPLYISPVSVCIDAESATLPELPKPPPEQLPLFLEYRNLRI